ncbi:hypothetical protein M513_01421 [Trichuris suis]|uniref:Uncharacterized protein n=1 Tax=Trichuris suis TaxID=68888 RepID=A0A085MKK5_9BILA|nr:hypothetical protein M513_01421 [Trichuris suis]
MISRYNIFGQSINAKSLPGYAPHYHTVGLSAILFRLYLSLSPNIRLLFWLGLTRGLNMMHYAIDFKDLEATALCHHADYMRKDIVRG